MNEKSEEAFAHNLHFYTSYVILKNIVILDIYNKPIVLCQGICLFMGHASIGVMH